MRKHTVLQEYGIVMAQRVLKSADGSAYIHSKFWMSNQPLAVSSGAVESPF